MSSSHDIALLRLTAQRIPGPRLSSPLDAVDWLTAVQGQDLPGALTAIALRTESLDRAAVTDAFNSGQLVRSWPMRGTLHVMTARDMPWMVRTLGSRGLAAAKGRRAQLG